MADEWYCEIAGREIGPLSAQQLRAMAAKGQILSNDCVRQGEQGSWVLARQVRGLLQPSPDLARPKPPVFQAPVPESLPETPVAPSPPPPPPVAPPQANDVFDVVALGIVTDEPTGVHARAKIALSRKRRRLERQRITVGLLAAAVVGLAIVGLALAFGRSSSAPTPSGSTPPAKKAPAVKADAESPEALEAREGIKSLDSPKHERHTTDVETPKTPVAADSDATTTAGPRDSTKAVPKKQPGEPKRGAPKGDPSSL
jgi:hypothetical protein